MAPRILIFLIAIGADNSFYVKFIATYVPTFFEYIISVLAIVARSTYLVATLILKLKVNSTQNL